MISNVRPINSHARYVHRACCLTSSQKMFISALQKRAHVCRGEDTMLGTISARSILYACSQLLNFSAPVPDYSSSPSEDITTAAWKATGASMRRSMSQIDVELGYSPGRFTNN